MKRLIIICMAIIAATQAYAQLDITSEGQKMVRQAFTDALVLVRQNYVVVDADNNKYGLGEEEYFGRAIGVGVRTDCGLAMLTSVAQPWKKDPKFGKYKDKYRPEISLTEFRGVGDTAFGKMKPVADKFLFVNDSVISYAQNVTSEKSLGAVLPEEGKVAGWLVLLTSKEPIENDPNSSLAIDVYKQTVNFDKKQRRYPIESTSSMNAKNIVGGIFVVPTYEMGQITFQYAGLLNKTKEGWTLVLTTKNAMQCAASKTPAKDKDKAAPAQDEKLKPLNKKDEAEVKNDTKADKKQKSKKQDEVKDEEVDDQPATESDNDAQLKKINKK